MKRFKPSTQYNFVTGTFTLTEPTPRPKRKKTPTNSLTAQIVNYVEMRGGFAMRINVSGFYREDVGYIRSGSTVGVPDVIAVVSGRFVGVEIKTGNDRQSDEQKAVQARIEAVGGVYIVARDFGQFQADFEEILRKF